MQMIKYVILGCIFLVTSGIGMLYAKTYTNREKELKEMKNALMLFKTKLYYTYETIPEVFKEVAEKISMPIANIFLQASIKMEGKLAGEAWIEAVEQSENNLKQEDKKVIKDLSKLLGQTDIEGQISSIELVTKCLDNQIEQASIERQKNEKLYRTLGATLGIGLVILLI